MIGLQWTVIPGAGTAVWPASGIGFAGLVLGGLRLWPAIFLGRFLAAVAVGSPQPWWADAWLASATTLGTLVPLIWIKRVGGVHPAMGRLRDAARLVLVGAAGGALLSGPLAMAGLWLAGAPLGQLARAGAAWCLGFGVGIVVVAPVILSWSRRRSWRLSKTAWAHLALCLAATATVSIVVFLQPAGGVLRTWHVLPVLIWPALAFSVRGASLSLLVVSAVALVSAMMGLGPLSEVPQTAAARLAFTQQFLAVTSVAMLVLASAVDERRAKSEIAKLEALRSAILDAALDCIVTISDDDRVVEWNGACERTFGYRREEVVGRALTELIIPPEHVEAHRRGMERFLATGQGPVIGRRLELEAIRADGRRFPVELAIHAIDVDGRPHFTAYLRDITDQKQARADALESEQRLRATYEHAFAGIAEVSPEGRFLRVNERFCGLVGYSRDELSSRTIWDISHPDDHVEERERFRRHMAGEIEVYTVGERYLHKNGQVVWVELAASRVVDDLGQPLYGIRVVHDVSQRRRWEQQQLLLINELNHRVKNTLATVQSIVAQTTRLSGSPAEIRARIEGRLLALSEAHNLLTRENWEGADLREIIERAIAPFRASGDHRIRVQGGSVRLSPRQAVALSMALHELGTNAVKYGALSGDAGWVEVLWTFAGPGGGTLALEWREAGGPRVAAPTSRGFGSRLLERGLAQDLEGEVELNFDPEGVVCRITAPITRETAPHGYDHLQAPALD